MSAVDIRSVDKKTLPQISSIDIDESLSPQERAASFMKQLSGRYCYADGEMIVGFSYAETDVKLSTKLAMYANAIG